MTFRPFWLDQALRSEHAAPCPPLAGDTRADVCIVGGGYTGLWTAIMLSEHDPGLDVVLVEADLCGAGASGAATAAARCPGRPSSSPWNGCSD